MECRKYDEFKYVLQKKVTQFMFLRALFDWKLTTSLLSLVERTSHNYNRNDYYIGPHLDARYWGFSNTTGRVKIIFIYPRFSR